AVEVVGGGSHLEGIGLDLSEGAAGEGRIGHHEAPGGALLAYLVVKELHDVEPDLVARVRMLGLDEDQLWPELTLALGPNVNATIGAQRPECDTEALSLKKRGRELLKL